MAKREFIDKAMMLREYGDILDYDINHPKYENTVRDIIEEANEITEQKIVKPYLEELKTKLKNHSYEEPESTVCFCDKEPTWIVDLDDIEYEIDNLLSELEPKNEL